MKIGGGKAVITILFVVALSEEPQKRQVENSPLSVTPLAPFYAGWGIREVASGAVRGGGCGLKVEDCHYKREGPTDADAGCDSRTISHNFKKKSPYATNSSSSSIQMGSSAGRPRKSLRRAASVSSSMTYSFSTTVAVGGSASRL